MERQKARQERIKFSEKTMSEEDPIGFSLYKDEVPQNIQNNFSGYNDQKS